MSQPHILCIDDEPLSIKVLEAFLSEHFRVSTALSATEALEMIVQDKPDLIVSDVLMPDLNGFEMVGKLRETPESNNIPLIFISSLSQLSNIGTSERSGTTQFFTKPIDNKQLLDSINQLLQKSR